MCLFSLAYCPQLLTRHALGKYEPSLDECNDWTLISSYRNPLFLTVELRRKLKTGDPQDRPVVADGTLARVIFALGTGNDGQFRFFSLFEQSLLLAVFALF